MLKKSVFIEHLQEGSRFDEIFLVRTAKLGETKAGKPYLLLTLADKTGELAGPVWEDAARLAEICQPGEFVRVAGSVQSYNGKPQLRIENITAVIKTEVDLDGFVAVTPKNREKLAEDLQALIRSVSEPSLRKLLQHFFKKDGISERVPSAPAAKGIHHAYLGGLLEHIVSMAQVADALSAHYEGVDRSLLIAGALLHDIGKVEELAMNPESGLIDYTDAGRLKGHLAIGSEMVGRAAAKIADFPNHLLVQLQHCILSHHGRQEFGSPVVPMTVEAFLLSAIDDLDAKMNLFEQLRRKVKHENMEWSEYQRSLERFLYLNRLPGDDRDNRAEGEPLPNRQPKLF